MAKKNKRTEPITNAVVAARTAGDVLQKAYAALTGVQQAMRLIDENPDLDADQIRSALAINRSAIDEACFAFDWSE